MIKSMRIGNTFICYLNNKMYQKSFNTNEEVLGFYERISNVNEEDQNEIKELIKFFTPQKSSEEIKIENQIKELESEKEQQDRLLNWFKEIKKENDAFQAGLFNTPFTVEGFKFYVKGINITVPEDLVWEFYKRKDSEEDTKAMLNFWRLLALNNDPRCRENTFKFLQKHQLSITPSGYFIGYRNVNIYQEGNNKELNDFVNKMWIKIKGWKKSPKNYSVVLTEEGYDILLETDVVETLFTKIIGNLDNLYNNPTNDQETIYTDNHTGKFRIKIGEMVSMPKEQCDHSQDNECSRGLHISSSSWTKKNNFGQQGIVCLVNPSDIVSIPYADAGKMRCWRYLPIGLAEYDDNGNIIPIETNTFEYQFSEYTEQELQEMINKSDLEELKSHEIVPKEIDIQSLKSMLSGVSISKEEMNQVIKNKVVKFNG